MMKMDRIISVEIGSLDFEGNFTFFKSKIPLCYFRVAPDRRGIAFAGGCGINPDPKLQISSS